VSEGRGDIGSYGQFCFTIDGVDRSIYTISESDHMPVLPDNVFDLDMISPSEHSHPGAFSLNGNQIGFPDRRTSGSEFDNLRITGRDLYSRDRLIHIDEPVFPNKLNQEKALFISARPVAPRSSPRRPSLGESICRV
jgi:hypothetical protein